MNDKKDDHPQSPLDTIFCQEICKDPQVLTTKASDLSEYSLAQILKHIDENELPSSLLQPLLKGITTQQFRKIIEISDQFPRCLVNASQLKELQQHVSVLAKDLENEIKDIDQQLFEIKRLITALDMSQADREEIVAIDLNLMEIESKLWNTISFTKRGLILAWNSALTDVIDLMSWVKEHALMLIEGSNNKYITPHGLSHYLVERITNVYGLSTNIVPLQEDTTAFEALSRVGLIDVNDYVDAGLVSKEEGSLDKIVKKLAGFHLYNLSSLIQQRIFSKNSFAHWIKSNK